MNAQSTFRRDDPFFFPELTASPGFPWRCYVWENNSSLFATTWGTSLADAASKADRIVALGP